MSHPRSEGPARRLARRRTRRRWRRIALLGLLLLVAPSVVQRIIAPVVRVRIVEDPAVSAPAATVPPATERSPRPLRIVVWNIAHGRGLARSNWDGGDIATRGTRLDRMGRILADLAPDIVILNEVDFDASWSHRTNQALVLGRIAGLPYRAEQRNVDGRALGWRWSFGNAVLSRFPIESAEVIDLPGDAAWETAVAGKKRGVLCTIDVDGRTVRVAGVHLSSRARDVRRAGAHVVTELVDDDPTPLIVAGDLNDAPAGFPSWGDGAVFGPPAPASDAGAGADTDADADADADADDGTDDAPGPLEILDATGAFDRRPRLSDLGAAYAPDVRTYRADDPRVTIDWILTPADWSIIDHAVLPTDLSDHRPVVTDVVLTPPGP